ncbi:glycerol-3-phosphate acyltransferase [Faecalicatena sp. AGMB00832]|uniref:Glycerol-3-phosphate acyltransferase n=1 Tax=Faecalicatena faecalis TaxID=2726362 RepID=A0ABS6D089_9FIRM|nr:glycerol-3-phosphate acyltransferase [Faecalicatena faecalis]MBU3875002.1 glycerol-3-phosphate acyltransferase [Faecalicatena faecalis]
MKYLCLFIGYCFGNFLTAEVVARKYTGKHAAQIGSGNPGMANIMATVGKKQGFIVLGGDFLKTVLAFVISWLIAGDVLKRDVILWSGFGTLLGHNFPIWNKFRGGKGVAVTCTWLVVFMPLWGTLCCVAGGIVTLVSGYLPLGAVLIALLAVPAALFTENNTAAGLMLVSLAIMIYKHRHGLRRIMNGEEERKFRK